MSMTDGKALIAAMQLPPRFALSEVGAFDGTEFVIMEDVEPKHPAIAGRLSIHFLDTSEAATQRYQHALKQATEKAQVNLPHPDTRALEQLSPTSYLYTYTHMNASNSLTSVNKIAFHVCDVYVEINGHVVDYKEGLILSINLSKEVLRDLKDQLQAYFQQRCVHE